MMAADYRHIGGVENRLGRHYSRFSPFSPTPALADQSLAWRKLWNAGSNRRSRANVVGASVQKETTFLNDKAPCIGARRADVPADRPSSGQSLNGLDGEA